MRRESRENDEKREHRERERTVEREISTERENKKREVESEKCTTQIERRRSKKKMRHLKNIGTKT